MSRTRPNCTRRPGCGSEDRRGLRLQSLEPSRNPNLGWVFNFWVFWWRSHSPPKPIFTDDGKTIVIHFSSNTNDQHVDLFLHRYAPPIKDVGVPEAARYSCAPYAKVSAPLCHCCMRNHKPKQSACVRDDERGPLTRCDTERARTNQSLQHRRDMRPRYALKCLCG